MFNINVQRRIKEVLDGTSRTVAFSEVIQGASGTPDIRGYWWGYFGHQHTHMRGPNSPLGDRTFDFPRTTNFCNEQKPNMPCGRGAACWTAVIISPRRYRRGGGVTARADGSVHFVWTKSTSSSGKGWAASMEGR